MSSRLNRTNAPIQFRADFPIFQVQPLPREVLDEARPNDYEIVPTMEQLRPKDRDAAYGTVVRLNVIEIRPRGMYATAARKRRKGNDGGT